MKRFLKRDPLGTVAISFALLLLASAAVLTVGLIAGHAGVCDKQQQAKSEYCPPNSVVSFLWAQGWKLLNDYSPAITALGTACIAWFTITLARVGRNQHRAAARSNVISRRAARAASESAQAAILQAKAAIGVELPFLVLSEVAFNPRSGNGTLLLDNLVYPRFVVSIKNYGRTTAFITQAGADTYFGDLPPRPNWLEYFDLNSTVVIDKDGVYDLENTYRRRKLSESEVESVIRGGYLWICWFVAYRDFLGRQTIYRDARQLYILNDDLGYAFLDTAPEAYRGLSYQE